MSPMAACGRVSVLLYYVISMANLKDKRFLV